MSSILLVFLMPLCFLHVLALGSSSGRARRFDVEIKSVWVLSSGWWVVACLSLGYRAALKSPIIIIVLMGY